MMLNGKIRGRSPLIEQLPYLTKTDERSWDVFDCCESINARVRDNLV